MGFSGSGFAILVTRPFVGCRRQMGFPAKMFHQNRVDEVFARSLSREPAPRTVIVCDDGPVCLCVHDGNSLAKAVAGGAFHASLNDLFITEQLLLLQLR